MAQELVVLVDENDNILGEMEKLEAHKTGALHRAVSVFIFNKDNQMLIHQRAAGKYHSPLLWTNACCSHPRPGETTEAAAKRRLQEEMGITCDLKPVLKFTYNAAVGNGMTEHELDHVFVGYTNQKPNPNAQEVKDWTYTSIDNIKTSIVQKPEKFTAWFKLILDPLMKALNNA